MKQAPLLHFYQFNIPPNGNERTVRVLLPTDYLTTARRYPVIYALDGQNLFEAKTAFGGRHWKVPESMSKLPKKLQAIVVGIDNAGAGRIAEYAPFRRGRQGGGGEAHLHFIMGQVKPFMDATYRTLPQKATTAIVGSSLGGLLALYAGLRFGEVFGRVGALSPSLWFNPQVLQLAENPIAEPPKIYVVGSRTEAHHMEAILQKTYWALRKGGFPDERMRVAVRERGKHNEAFWGREFPKLHRWLFG